MTSLPVHRPTVARIDLDALGFNFRSVKEFVGREIGFMAIVKANAYGHGSIECARRLQAEGVDWFGVATVEEGVDLRSGDITSPILVLGGFWPGQEASLLEFDLTPAVFRPDQIRSFAKTASLEGSIARVHIKIDTGMGRVGIRLDEVEKLMSEAATIENLEIDGLMTHFAVADDLSQNEFTNHQISSFSDAVEVVHSYGHRPSFIDLANSPGAVAHPLSRSKMVRIGGVLYGLGGDVLPGGIDHPELKPVMSVWSKIAQVKRVRPGASIGYGRTFVAERDTTVATVPIGYHDGLPRALSNNGHFLINGVSAPIIGRVSMDWTTVDVTEVPNAVVGTDVTIIGASGSCQIRAEDLASKAGTISYEITCGISSRVPREYEGS